MEEREARLQEKLQRLLKEAAEVEVELSRQQGAIRGVPHYSVIEGRAHELGRRLSREVQSRQMGELMAGSSGKAKCPECGSRCQVQPHKRQVASIDGELEIQEAKGYCPTCRRDFFPR